MMSLSLTIHHVLVNIYRVTKRNAAGMIGNAISKNERTVQEWNKSINDMEVASLTVSRATTRGRVFFGKMRYSVRQFVIMFAAMLL